MRLNRLLLLAGQAGKTPAKAGNSKAQEILRNKDAWRTKVSGMNLKDVKKHYSLIPIYAFTVLALGLAGAYVIRLATQHPEVSWTKNNPEPWNDYKNKQYKFVNSGRDYSKGSPAPSVK